jgi:DNA repair exonuclease SbcCD nuclease subunit
MSRENKATITFHAIGDVHISDNHLHLSREAMAGSIKLVEKDRDVDFVVVMGDVFDRHDNVKLSHMTLAHKFIKDLSALKPTVVLVGNHDRVNNKDFMSPIHPYMGIKDEPKKLYIADRPKLLILRKVVDGVEKHFKILFMPYVEPGRFVEAINRFIEDSHKLDKHKDITRIEDLTMIFAH